MSFSICHHHHTTCARLVGGRSEGCFGNTDRGTSPHMELGGLADTIIIYDDSHLTPISPQLRTPHIATGENCPAIDGVQICAKSVQISETLKLADITDRIWIFSFIIDTLSRAPHSSLHEMIYFYFSHLSLKLAWHTCRVYLTVLGGPSSINWAISYPADKDCRIENTGKETRKHSSSLLLLIHWPALRSLGTQILIF